MALPSSATSKVREINRLQNHHFIFLGILVIDLCLFIFYWDDKLHSFSASTSNISRIITELQFVNTETIHSSLISNSTLNMKTDTMCIQTCHSLSHISRSFLTIIIMLAKLLVDKASSYCLTLKLERNIISLLPSLVVNIIQLLY